MARTYFARDIMARKLVTLSPEMSAFDAIGLLLKNRISGAPVVGPNREYLGVFSEKTCMKVLLDAATENLPCTTVGCVADHEARTIDEETDLLTIAHIFHQYKVRRLPVLRDGRVIGQVSRRDVLRAAHDLLAIAPEREGNPLLYLSSLKPHGEASFA